MDSQQQQFCLKWNSFGTNLATSFSNLFKSDTLADVTLSCEGVTFKAHKLILAACSKHLADLFETAPPYQNLIIILDGTSAPNMAALLEFMYKGEVHVSQDSLPSFLKAAECLQVKGLSVEHEKLVQSHQHNHHHHQNNHTSSSVETILDSPISRKHLRILKEEMENAIPNHHHQQQQHHHQQSQQHHQQQQQQQHHHQHQSSPSPSYSPAMSPYMHPHHYRQYEQRMPATASAPFDSSPSASMKGQQLRSPIDHQQHSLHESMRASVLRDGSKSSSSNNNTPPSMPASSSSGGGGCGPPSSPPAPGGGGPLSLAFRSSSSCSLPMQQQPEADAPPENNNNNRIEPADPASTVVCSMTSGGGGGEGGSGGDTANSDCCMDTSCAEDLRIKMDPNVHQDETPSSTANSVSGGGGGGSGGGTISTSSTTNIVGNTNSNNNSNSNTRPENGSISRITLSKYESKEKSDLIPASLWNSVAGKLAHKTGTVNTPDGKKLKCPFCERLYGYETNLRAHIRQRHQGIRVPCPFCSRTFTRNNTVRRHIAREHKAELSLKAFQSQQQQQPPSSQQQQQQQTSSSQQQQVHNP